MKDTLLIIDGHSMAFRAFYALPAENFRTSTGQHTNAVYGFISMLVRLIETEKPSHIAVAFDLSRHSFRTEIYPEYKGTRDATPEEFKGQVELIQEVLADMGIQSLTKEGYEADDILATLAFQGNERQWRVLVASGDRDSFQLVTDNVTVLYPGMSTADLRYMTPEAVESKYGVPPSRYPELAALVGEKSDNLPGVPGVGPKTAAQWIVKYDGLENLLNRADEIGGKRGEALREHSDDVRRNRQLNHLLTDLDVGVNLDDLLRGPTNRQGINARFDALEFGGLRERVFATSLPSAAATIEMREESVASSEASSTEESAQEGAQTDPLSPLVDILPLEVESLSAHANARQGRPWALTVRGQTAPARGEAHALALACDGVAFVLDCVEASAEQLRACADIIEGAPLVTHDGKATWHALRGIGLECPTPVFDTELAAYLLRPEQRSYDIDTLAELYLDYRVVSADSGDDGGLFALPEDGQVVSDGLQQLGAHAGVLLALEPVLSAQLRKDNAAQLLTDMELPVQRTLAVMEDRGIAVDTGALDDLSSSLGRDVERAQTEAWQVIGHEVNLSSPKQLQVVLFDELNLPKTKKTKTGYTTNAEALQALFDQTGHPFLEHLLAHRDRIKLKQMVETLRHTVGDDERIHSTFSQVVAATGRLASSEPNLQNIPTRTDAGRQIRDAFVAGAGFDALLSADYSQIEMRIMAHLSQDAGLIEAFNSGEDLHRTMAAMVFHTPVDEVTPEQRSRIKATSYGLAYGLSAFGLSQQLKISVGEAGELRERYFQRFGGVQRYLADIVEQARIDGYTQTMFGRRRYLPDLNSPNRQLREMAERAALNAPIQGSAADIIKIAMVEVENSLVNAGLRSRLLVQIHDELLLEVRDEERDAVESMVREHMGAAVSMSVPLEVAVGWGRSWKDAAH